MNSDSIDRAEYEDTALFYAVDFEETDTQLNAAEVVNVDQGVRLIDAEQINSYLYLLLDGGLKVPLGSVENGAIAQLYPGDCVSELSVLSKVNFSAIIPACETCRLLKLGDVILWSMIDVLPALARNLLYILSGQIRKSNHRLFDNIKSQQLVWE